ncbi:hypothetical protein PSEUBRA_004106 [Kalmanozyma brasiliensis GHG001]|uniref:BSD domain-containing protein n=1 Tax=Kalmanozyma brasiliensis (strain GHG001) TaxID=1365824 RepID=V5EM68_KALBG|nr:uncharacterized protein PSEUBRA_004106 [Kalmanozyma brasiliensis GHG001]EST06225.1 hypothetical protein PSEUBRA_004106 [Kalmanozyma brasiliensis GHG001]
MDLRDPNIIEDTDRVDGSGTSTSVTTDTKTDLDQNVEKIVGSISSWFTGFAKKSQDTIIQARKEMEDRGGIVNYAKSEYAKLESSLEEAQKNADDNLSTLPATSVEDAFLHSEKETSKGKGKERVVNDQDAPATAADSGDTAHTGPTLGASVTSLFSKITSDPRIASLQQSLTSTLQSVSSPTSTGTEKDADGTERTTGPTPINLQESLSKLSLTIQSHLPHLDLKESQQLATKYLHATENYAREIQSDMKDFVGELVRIVPPEGEAAQPGTATALAPKPISKDTSTSTTESSAQQDAKATTPATTESSALAASDLKSPSAESEEDFAWDGEDDEAAAAAAKPEATTPSTAKAAAPAPDTTVAAGQDKKPTQSKTEDSDEDSDWE